MPRASSGKQPHRRAPSPTSGSAKSTAGSQLIAPHHQARHPEGAIDAAPLVARQIKRNEQIAGKKRGFDRAQFARVPNGLMALRQESPEALILELYLRAALAQRQRMHDVPAL